LICAATYPEVVSYAVADPPPGIELFDTPEQAALAGWRSTPGARARVIGVRQGKEPRIVFVTVRTDGHPGFHDRDISTCLQAPNGQWWESASAGA